MSAEKHIILTTINYPTEGVETIARTKKDWTILAVADRKTPPDWNCPNEVPPEHNRSFGGDILPVQFPEYNLVA